MHKVFLPAVFLLLSSALTAQRVTKKVMMSSNGATRDPKEATSLMVVKRYSDTSYEKLDYNMYGPMSKSQFYKDADLKILHGTYLEYGADGMLSMSGSYIDNKKNGEWNRFNDSGKVISKVKYRQDSLIETVDLSKKDSAKKYPDEKEPEFPKGQKGWVEYLVKSLEKSKAAAATKKGGTVVVAFAIDREGNTCETFIFKSVEFDLDEESLGMIKGSPKWKPAFENGNNVKAYLRQPITFRPL